MQSILITGSTRASAGGSLRSFCDWGIVATDLLLYSSRGRDAADWERAKRTLNILGDTVETVTPFLAREALASTRQGARINWMTPAKAAGRVATSFFRKRDILSELEARTDLTVR